MTFILVTIGIWSLGQPTSIAVLLGVLALATAPATTILVLKELESEGPVTEYSQAMVAMNNMVTIILFELIFVGIHFLRGSLEFPVMYELGFLARDLLGSVLVGVLGGLWISFCYALVAESRRVILLVATVILLLGVCHGLGIPYLLTFLAMGGMVANSTYHSRQISIEMDRVAALLCVIFFVVHGAELNLNAFATVGLIGVFYIVLRILGKYLGVYAFARNCQDEPHLRHWLGVTLLSQAGAAIALADIATTRDPAIGEPASGNHPRHGCRVRNCRATVDPRRHDPLGRSPSFSRHLPLGQGIFRPTPKRLELDGPRGRSRPLEAIRTKRIDHRSTDAQEGAFRTSKTPLSARSFRSSIITTTTSTLSSTKQTN